ncbi:MAG: polyprenyl diphosphate synthase [Chloroflexota bacterium]
MVIPKHVAFVMDGNGRWAQAQGLPRSAGHKAGYEHIPTVLEICFDLDIQVVSGYVWSTENWNRPKAEVDFIVRSLEKNLSRFVGELHQRGVRFVHSGTHDRLPTKIVELLKNGASLTKDNQSGVFNLCFNYGGRTEIVEAVQRILAADVQPNELSEELLGEYLWTHSLPDVDLVVRTGGDKRLSNFLLWQTAHACLYIADSYWPAISRQEIEFAVSYYNEVMFGRSEKQV